MPRCSTSTVRPYGTSLMHERHELLANDLRHAKREIAIRDHALAGTAAAPRAGARRSASTSRSRFSPVRAETGKNSANGRCASFSSVGNSSVLLRERIDLVEHEERSLELAFEHLDRACDPALVSRPASTTSNATSQSSSGLVDLPRHEPVQRALGAARMARRVDEHRLIRRRDSARRARVGASCAACP